MTREKVDRRKTVSLLIYGKNQAKGKGKREKKCLETKMIARNHLFLV